MAFRETQSAIVIDTLIADLVHEAVDQRQSIKEPIELGPCKRLYDILGITPCNPNGAEIDKDSEFAHKEWIENKGSFSPICSAPTSIHSRCDLPSDSPLKEQSQQWHSWLVPALADDSSGDELEIYRRNGKLIKQVSDVACQTKPIPIRKRNSQLVTPGLFDRAPCELNRQTIFIDAGSVSTPNLQSRPPLADRFCYMLTDFASALYCSLAIMCCCTPNMFR